MPKEHIDTDNLSIPGKASVSALSPGLQWQDDVLIIVTQAFGPKGDNLVGISDVTFNGYPAVTIGVRARGQEGLVHISPFHGDKRKIGFAEIEPGTRCELFCPVSGELFEKLGSVDDGSGADYYAIYLTPDLSDGQMVSVSNIWGHYHSRIVDNFDLISYWATHEPDFG